MMPTPSSEFDKRVITCSQLFGQKGESAEWHTATYLVDNLRPKRQLIGDYRILMNYNLARGIGTAGSLEVDLIVISQFGVFLIEVKDWYGKIIAYDGHWEQITKTSTRKHEDIFGVTNHKSKVLHAKLFGPNGDLRGIGNVSVAGLIVLRQGAQSFSNQSKSFENSKTVLGLTPNLINALSSTSFLHNGSKSQMLTDKNIESITNALHNSHNGSVQIIGNYRVVREILPGDLYDAYEAVSIPIENQHVRIKRYKIPHFSSNDDKVIENFERNARAVAKLEAHPNILLTYNFFPHPSRADIFFEITELIKGDRLDQILSKQEISIPFNEQLKYLHPLCSALGHAHRHEIYHRNLSPETVYVTETGVVKLGDFDFAKLGGRDTISIDGQLPVENLLIAPELESNASDYASAKSDIYSLGCLWYLLSALPHHPQKIDVGNVEKLNLPAAAKDLLKKMIDRVPERRPRNITEVLKTLNQFSAEQ